MTTFSVFSLISLIFVTIVQHETGVVLWYRFFQHDFSHWAITALVTLIVVSIIDFFWLYSLFYVFRKSFSKIGKFESFHRLSEYMKSKAWFQKIQAFFAKPDESPDVNDRDSGFRRFVKKSGGLGIFMCGSLPGPGLKEIGIVMALTPKYRDHGFAIMFLGGLFKTSMTMAIYGGFDQILKRLFETIVT